MTDKRDDAPAGGPIKDVIEGGKKRVAKLDDARAKKQEAENQFPTYVGKGDDDVRPARGELPPDCPVTPLGLQGNTYHYLDALDQLTTLEAGKHGRLHIQGLFGARLDALYTFWPKVKKDSYDKLLITGWKAEDVAEALMSECARRGLFDAFGRVRGPGAWRDDEGGLIMHCGDRIITPEEEIKPGTIGRFVYPAAPKKPRPARDDVTPGEDIELIDELRDLLDAWSWRRQDLDPQLLLGWLGAAMIGGALDWRPLAWITGDAATGKSTLQRITKLIFDDDVVAVTNVTAAGIWQKIDMASTPIAIDELEAEADNRQQQSVLRLAREAASGGVTLRGGQDHKGTEFKSQSCFLFASILIPPLSGQDRSRMAILELLELSGTKPPDIDDAKLRRTGAMMRMRLMSNWAALQNRIEAYRLALAGVGHKGRGADVFGTLLAVADVLLSDAEPSEETLAGWAEKCRADALTETAENQANHERCVDHLLSSATEVRRAGRPITVGEWVELLMDDVDIDAEEAKKVLTSYGLKPQPTKGPTTHLAVANDHRQLAKLFDDTSWANGVWAQAMRRIPGSEGSQLRFAGKRLRCQVVPIDAFFDQNNDDPAGPERAARRGDHIQSFDDI